MAETLQLVDGNTKNVQTKVHKEDGWVIVCGETYMYKSELKERFDARWDNDEKGWIIDIINMQHDDDGVNTPQAICDWLQQQIDERNEKREQHKQENALKRKMEREERDAQKKQKKESLQSALPREKKNCYANAKLYESHSLDRTYVAAGFYAQCPDCSHYLYGMDKNAEERSAYYSHAIHACWFCSAQFGAKNEGK